jgi:hypothetical protein
VDFETAQGSAFCRKGVKAMATQPITPISRKQSAPKPKLEITRTSKFQWIDFEEVLRHAADEQERDLARQILRDVFSNRNQASGTVAAQNYQPGGGRNLVAKNSALWDAARSILAKLENTPYTVNVQNYYTTAFNVWWNYHLKNGLPGSDPKFNVNPEATVTFQYPHFLEVRSYSLWVYTGDAESGASTLWDSGEMLVSDINALEQETYGIYHNTSDSWGVNRTGGSLVDVG